MSDTQGGAHVPCSLCGGVLSPCVCRPYVVEAGAVPSQDDHELAQRLIRASKGWMQERIAELEAHRNTIRSYVIEAAKTPIAREDMRDPLKAQTFYDEAQGLYRLILSETGDGQAI